MRRAKPLSEVWIHFERQKIDNKYKAKCKYQKQEKKTGFLSWCFFSGKKKNGFFHRKKTIYITRGKQLKVNYSEVLDWYLSVLPRDLVIK